MVDKKEEKAGIEGRIGGALNRIWFWQSVFGLFTDTINKFTDRMPQFIHGVTVRAVGGPAADLRRVWYLCCAAAFGRILKSPALRGGEASMQAVWDVTGKACQIELVYKVAKTQYSEDTPRPGRTKLGIVAGIILGPGAGVVVGGGLAPGVGAGAGPAIPVAPSPKDSPLVLVQMGPDQVTVGANWPGFLLRHDQATVGTNPPPSALINQTVPVTNPQLTIIGATADLNDQQGMTVFREWPRGATQQGPLGGRFNIYPHRRMAILRTARAVAPSAESLVTQTQAPTLPDDTRLITTGEKNDPNVQPVKPWVDGVGRTSLLSLVAATLATPCFLPAPPPPTLDPLVNTVGLFVSVPGTPGLTYGSVSDAVLREAQINPLAASTAPFSPDAYPLLPGDPIPDVRGP